MFNLNPLLVHHLTLGPELYCTFLQFSRNLLSLIKRGFLQALNMLFKSLKLS